jgi:hypothetical protein
MDTPPITVIARPRRPIWQTAVIWFGAGLLLTGLAAYYFDRRSGRARRQMAVDRMRQLRDRAQGAMVELRDREQSSGRAAI